MATSQTKETLERQLAELQAEYDSLSERLSAISGSEYAGDLRQRVLALDLRIKKMEKHRKGMELTQRKNASLIQHAENTLPEAELAGEKKLLVLDSARLKEMDAEIDRQSGSMGEFATVLDKTRSLHLRLSAEAKTLGIEVVPNPKSVALCAKIKGLEEKKAALGKTVALVKTRHHMALGDYCERTARLQLEARRVAAELQRKSEYR